MSVQSFKYLEQFQCLGADCPDHCCRDWAIALDPSRLRRLKAAMRQNPSVNKRLDAAIAVTGGLARVELDPQGKCTLLEGDGRCFIHSQLGEDHLPRPCATYPRNVLKTTGGRIMTGEVSCPEIGRLLMCFDNAMEDITAPPPGTNEGLIIQEQHAESATLRATVTATLAQSSTIWGGIADATQVLGAPIDVTDPAAPATVATCILVNSQGGQARSDLGPLIDQCWPGVDDDTAISVAAWESHQDCLRRIRSDVPGRLAQYARHLSLNHWAGYGDGEDHGLVHQQTLLVLLNLLVLLLPHHSFLKHGDGDFLQRMDSAAIDIVYRCARTMERSSICDTVVASLRAAGFAGANTLLILLKL